MCSLVLIHFASAIIVRFFCVQPTASERPSASQLLQRPLLASELERELYATKQENETLLRQLKQVTPKPKRLRRIQTVI